MTLSDIKAKLTAPDKILHGKASVGVLVAAIAIVIVGYMLGLHPVSIMLLEAGVLAAAAVEGAQWHDNKLATDQGRPATRDVSALDAFYSTLAPLVAVVALEVVRWLGKLPEWLNVFTTDRLPFWM